MENVVRHISESLPLGLGSFRSIIKLLANMKFDFSISFSGSHRALARHISENLIKRGYRVFFDENFEHELLGKDGTDYLNKVFFEESQFCIALLSTEYEKSAWTQLERRAVQARELSGETGYLIPVLIDGHKPSWLLPSKIYYDLATRPLDKLIELLSLKIPQNEVDNVKIQNSTYESKEVNRLVSELEKIEIDSPEFNALSKFKQAFRRMLQEQDLSTREQGLELMAFAMDLPFTRFWEHAIQVNTISSKIQKFFLENLRVASENSGPEVGMLFVSYLYFTDTIKQTPNISKSFFDLLNKISIDQGLSTQHYREKAFSTLIELRLDAQRETDLLIPNPFSNYHITKDELAKNIFRKYLFPEEKEENHIKLLVNLWICIDEQYKLSIIEALTIFLSDYELPEKFDFQDITECVNELNIDRIHDNLILFKNKVTRSIFLFPELELLTKTEINTTAIENILSAFKEASRIADFGHLKNNSTLWGKCMDFLSPEGCAAIQNIQGNEFLFKFLMSISISTEIDSMFSIFSLIQLERLLGQEVYFLDDRITSAAFTKRDVGFFSGMNLIEALCSSDDVERDKQDFTNINIIFNLYNTIEDEGVTEKKTFISILNTYSKGSKRISLLTKHIKGKLSREEFIDQINQA